MLVWRNFGGHGHGQVGAPVVRVVEHNHGVALGVRASNLHRVLNGFGTRVQKHRALVKGPRGQVVELFSEFNVVFVRVDHEACVGESFHLFGHALHDVFVRVTHVGNRDSCTQVDDLVTVDVLEDSATRSNDVCGVPRSDTLRNGFVTPGFDLL